MTISTIEMWETRCPVCFATAIINSAPWSCFVKNSVKRCIRSFPHNISQLRICFQATLAKNKSHSKQSLHFSLLECQPVSLTQNELCRKSEKQLNPKATCNFAHFIFIKVSITSTRL